MSDNDATLCPKKSVDKKDGGGDAKLTQIDAQTQTPKSVGFRGLLGRSILLLVFLGFLSCVIWHQKAVEQISPISEFSNFTFSAFDALLRDFISRSPDEPDGMEKKLEFTQQQLKSANARVRQLLVQNSKLTTRNGALWIVLCCVSLLAVVLNLTLFTTIKNAESDVQYDLSLKSSMVSTSLCIFLVSLTIVYVYLYARQNYKPPKVLNKPMSWYNGSYDFPLVFRRPPETVDVQCDLIFANDPWYLEWYRKRRIKFDDPDDLSMSCLAIRTRNYFAREPQSKEEAEFPIAFSRVFVVHSTRFYFLFWDYIFTEMELAANYAPQNLYCYVIGGGASTKFHDRIRTLAACLPNVFVVGQVEVDSAGFGMNNATLRCFEKLSVQRRNHKWKYAFVLQTNAEIVRILKSLKGANDVELNPLMQNLGDVSNVNWTFTALELFKRRKLNHRLHNNALPELFLAKGYAAAALTRGYVDFVIRELNLTKLIAVLSPKGAYGVDEYVWPSLHITPALNIAGGMTASCVLNKIANPFVTRFAKWSENCLSGYHRHSLCVMGVEDLSRTIAPLKQIFVNKFLPTFDFGAAVCWYERIFERTHGLREVSDQLDESFYRRLPHARYQKLKDANGVVSEQKLRDFECRIDD
ncbi:hypothetical protein M3Y98_00706000 [Aphelenchoides besseyi]|nr:hypothetical protein M3Y98_00706000 [Aphelenchoides besseyi]KAI6210380.1 hypothetical protein M3Y96_00322000 [Aphelenchoides besseyi]